MVIFASPARALEAPSSRQAAAKVGEPHLIHRIADICCTRRRFDLRQFYAEERRAPHALLELEAWTRQRADADDPRAQFALCENAYWGPDGGRPPDDYRVAAEWCAKAAQHGFLPAQLRLGQMYYDGAGVPKDDREGLIWISRAAEGGDPDAQFSLATIFKDGIGVESDDARSLTWMRRAVQGENPNARVGLAYRFAVGYGVQRDEAEAARLLCSGWRTEEECEQHATATIAAAQFDRAQTLEAGDGFQQREDANAAFALFARSAELGDVRSQLRLARAYATGNLIAEDQNKATAWLRAAAAQGSDEAQTALGQR